MSLFVSGSLGTYICCFNFFFKTPISYNVSKIELLSQMVRRAGLEAEALGCVSGSYGWGHLLQIVPLVTQLRARGFTEEAAEKLLDSTPALAFSVHYGGRFDCDADIRVGV